MYENAKQPQVYFLKSNNFERGVIIEVQMAQSSVTNTGELVVIQYEQ